MGTTVLILGGYGTTGLMLSELLLEHGDANVVLAGRDLGRAERAAGELDTRYPGRVAARAADAADAASLEAALGGVDLVAVAASVLAHAGAVAEAALRAGVDYFDLLLSSPSKHATLERLQARIEAEDRCFITDGGIHPGLSAAMVRALAPRFERLERAAIGGLIKADWNAYAFSLSTIEEFAREMRDYESGALRNGRWGKVPWREALRSFDFGPPHGTQRCFLMSLEELRRLPEHIPSLHDCGFYVSGFNPVVDNIVMPLGMVAMKAAPGLLGPPYTRLLVWSLRRFSRPPYGVVWQVEAEGMPAGGPAGVAGDGPAGGMAGCRELGLRVSHADGYWLTAACAAACLLQYLDGSLRAPGVHLQALAVEPRRFLRDLHQMGAQVAGRGFDVAEIVA